MAAADAQLDAGAAASMISGFRGNNGLGPVALDPELMRIAEAQARMIRDAPKIDYAQRAGEQISPLSLRVQ